MQLGENSLNKMNLPRMMSISYSEAKINPNGREIRILSCSEEREIPRISKDQLPEEPRKRNSQKRFKILVLIGIAEEIPREIQSQVRNRV